MKPFECRLIFHLLSVNGHRTFCTRQWKLDCKPRPLLFFTPKRYFSVHQFYSLLNDCKSQSRTRNFVSTGAMLLRESLKRNTLKTAAHANAIVFNCYAVRVLIVCSCERNTNVTFFRRILYSVRQQVKYHFLNFKSVAAHIFSSFHTAVNNKHNLFELSRWLHGVRNGINDIPNTHD